MGHSGFLIGLNRLLGPNVFLMGPSGLLMGAVGVLLGLS